MKKQSNIKYLITETGRWRTITPDDNELYRWYGEREMWCIQHTAIISRMIKFTAQFTEHYLSDWYYLWSRRIECHLFDKEWEGGLFIFGFREFGVDEGYEVLANMSKYRKIVYLSVSVIDDEIKFVLSERRNSDRR